MSNINYSCRCDRMLVRDGARNDSARLHARMLSERSVVGVDRGGSIALGEDCNALSVSGRVEDALPNDCCNNEQSSLQPILRVSSAFAQLI